jgi:eukaryotic-like serine/threonine-protein kinase
MPTLEIDYDLETLLTPVVPTPVPIRWRQRAFEPHRLAALDRYKPVARLGQGGMAEVFLAAWEVAPHTHRPVVLKCLHAQFADEPRLVQMFLDEARLVCQLAHPNIVKALEVGTLDGRYCMAMEYLEGQSLDRVVSRAYSSGGTLSIELAVRIAIAVLDALHYAHEARDADGQPFRVVHRDISPQNIFVCNDGTVKVLDFGIAKTTLHEGRTASGVVKGKVAYIAPEQAGMQPVDRRADIWSVGVVLWEALTGMRMFKGDTDAATLDLTLRARVTPARWHRADLPSELDAILSVALQPSPSSRYPNAAVMRRRLAAWLETREFGDEANLSVAMHELFANEIAEQRRLLSELIVPSSAPRRDSTAPNSVGGVVVSNGAPFTAEHLSQVAHHVDHLTRQHRVLVRSLFGAVGVAAAALVVLAYMGGMRQGSQAAALAAAPPAVHGNVAAEALTVHPENITLHSEHPAEAARSTQEADDMVVLHPQSEPAPIAPAVEVKPSPARPRPAPDDAAAQAILSLPRVTASDLGSLTIDTVPWSTVSIAGKSLGQTPLVGVKLKPGSHVLTLHNPELGIRTQHTITIQPGKTLVRRIGLE